MTFKIASEFYMPIESIISQVKSESTFFPELRLPMTGGLTLTAFSDKSPFVFFKKQLPKKWKFT